MPEAPPSSPRIHPHPPAMRRLRSASRATPIDPVPDTTPMAPIRPMASGISSASLSTRTGPSRCATRASSKSRHCWVLSHPWAPTPRGSSRTSLPASSRTSSSRSPAFLTEESVRQLEVGTTRSATTAASMPKAIWVFVAPISTPTTRPGPGSTLKESPVCTGRAPWTRGAKVRSVPSLFHDRACEHARDEAALSKQVDDYYRQGSQQAASGEGAVVAEVTALERRQSDCDDVARVARLHH